MNLESFFLGWITGILTLFATCAVYLRHNVTEMDPIVDDKGTIVLCSRTRHSHMDPRIMRVVCNVNISLNKASRDARAARLLSALDYSETKKEIKNACHCVWAKGSALWTSM